MLLQITIFYLPLFTKIGGPLSVQVHLSLWACKLGCDPGGWALLTFARFNRQFNRKSEESCDSAMTSWQEYQRIHWVLLDHLKPFKTSCSLTEMNTAFWWLSTTSEGCFFFSPKLRQYLCSVRFTTAKTQWKSGWVLQSTKDYSNANVVMEKSNLNIEFN